MGIYEICSYTVIKYYPIECLTIFVTSYFFFLNVFIACLMKTLYSFKFLHYFSYLNHTFY